MEIVDRSVTRRRVLGASAHAAGAVALASVTLPALGFAIGPALESHPESWEPVGAPGDFGADAFTPRVITVQEGIGEAGKGLAYVRRRNPAVDGPAAPAFLALTSRCSHVGCPVNYVEAAQSFVCPCHGGVYDFRGQRIAGPPVRGLDRFETRVRAGQLEVGPRYSVDEHLHRRPARDPGEAVDGIGKYLYP
jgi:quinol---cytochrome c reductase iron-sulfur subunit, bacillus type